MKKHYYRIVVNGITKPIVHFEEDIKNLEEINRQLATNGCVVIGMGIYTKHSILYIQEEE
jgi:hypothetical protein